MTYDLWVEASRDHDQEAADRSTVLVSQASVGVFQYLALAKSDEEFEHRLALADASVQKVADETGASLDEVVALLTRRFALLSEARKIADLDAGKCENCKNGNHSGTNGTPGCSGNGCVCACTKTKTAGRARASKKTASADDDFDDEACPYGDPDCESHRSDSVTGHICHSCVNDKRNDEDEDKWSDSKHGSKTAADRDPLTGDLACPACNKGKHGKCSGWYMEPREDDWTDRGIECSCNHDDYPELGGKTAANPFLVNTGDKVVHPEHGEGEVQSINWDDNDNMTANVQYDNGVDIDHPAKSLLKQPSKRGDFGDRFKVKANYEYPDQQPGYGESAQSAPRNDKGIAVHTYGSTEHAYDDSQTNSDVKDGDVLSVPSEGVHGYLHAAWPVSVTSAHGEFHPHKEGEVKGLLDDGPSEAGRPSRRDSAAAAAAEAQKHGHGVHPDMWAEVGHKAVAPKTSAKTATSWGGKVDDREDIGQHEDHQCEDEDGDGVCDVCGNPNDFGKKASADEKPKYEDGAPAWGDDEGLSADEHYNRMSDPDYDEYYDQHEASRVAHQALLQQILAGDFPFAKDDSDSGSDDTDGSGNEPDDAGAPEDSDGDGSFAGDDDDTDDENGNPFDKDADDDADGDDDNGDAKTSKPRQLPSGGSGDGDNPFDKDDDGDVDADDSDGDKQDDSDSDDNPFTKDSARQSCKFCGVGANQDNLGPLNADGYHAGCAKEAGSKTATKVNEIALSILDTNPTMPVTEAKRLAAKVVASYPVTAETSVFDTGMSPRSDGPLTKKVDEGIDKLRDVTEDAVMKKLPAGKFKDALTSEHTPFGGGA